MREYTEGLWAKFKETVWQPITKYTTKTSALFISMFTLFIGAILSMHFFNTNNILSSISFHNSQKYPKHLMNCTAYGPTRACPSNYSYTPFNPKLDRDHSLSPTCPEYFRWIYEDLKPWAYTGISREMVERAETMGLANFRLVILNGKAYVETYRHSFQSRDIFTLWGILQLLRRYPGRVPDLDLMFNCGDPPVVLSKKFSGPNATSPPPVFNYCKDETTLDIVFPDWSFWGWPEINIKPWVGLLKDLKEGNKRKRWIKREPYAYWKGNPSVSPNRQDLFKCRASKTQDWNARLYAQDWDHEVKNGYKQSNLAHQCTNSRFKIYIEGAAWSVSHKYILSCDSMTLLVKPRYYDFFARGLIPRHHYWPIRNDDKCRSIKSAVDWGNSHEKDAQEIGKRGSKFIQEELKMEYVYDFMLHILNEYAKLLQYKPTIPPKATELCLEAMSCPANGLAKKFMLQSMVVSPATTSPCTISPPYSPSSLYSLFQRKANITNEVELLEKMYWQSQDKQKP
ncbi:uncharacterized protein LOC115717146 isoform X1 [Cannabis sativa]|uniref:uncharacterized protein LOC115717146 isoform X1 n=1 Tax=Cannabis sativa TaxID=3483 RepID=UPI0029CA0E46|nr:uncharacterized protein LOC115717146 isoform X1 [Cannabis sativa]XP_060971393.1 uncharacterized protein LOC115717146 isoform X1 [Cannabis sativa]XP_060971394.1 uncharacterized protein LOC115717146 isoform X1 [Cannabis sativa]XP_060971395.1 uncharacterized protein LOC115717146 isoform X1 [Cannabis sativa]XP_060971396.1 uncharacterized protein LOC115717146 isoform X1 [Cannabis sativa]XP_060971397.1 uncharacterized protein LOC115717146 isoform X1 [Cannabis sativa]XP_060971398.1 uncharacterize